MKYSWFLGLALSAGLMAACQDDDENTTPVNTLPPGTEYVKEGNYCLNVVYYIPKGGDTLSNWHYSASLLARAEQSFYKEQMAKAGYENCTFHLSVNKQNPMYVDVNLVQGLTDSVKEHRSFGAILSEIDNYWSLHPEKKSGAHTLVLVPGSNLFKIWYTEEHGATTGGTAIVGTDLPTSSSLSANTLGGLAQLMGMMFFLPASSEPIQDVYFSMMNAEKVEYWSAGGVELKKPDALWLSHNQVFSKQGQAYGSGKPEVNVGQVNLKYEQEQIRVSCEFTSAEHIVGVIVYNDPWSLKERKYDIVDSTSTPGDDAIPYVTEDVHKNGSNYRIELSLPWNDLPANYKVTPPDANYAVAEIRFRFLLDDGRAVPMGFSSRGHIDSGLRYPYAIQNYKPDFNIQIDTDLEEGNKTE